MDIKKYMNELGQQARAASRELNRANTGQKNSALLAIADAIEISSAFSIAGGGDTLAAIDQFNIADGVSYISTGGGAFLEYVEGKTLPAVAALEARYKS